MCHYKHLTLEDREGIMVMYIDGKSITDIADAIDRDKSTVSREVRRNTQGPSSKRSGYRAWRAQSNYEERRRLCGRRRVLEDRGRFDTVARLFLEEQLSPEQIEGRFVLEQGSSPVSDSTIYREIHSGTFDKLLPGRRKASRRLRHRGKRRKCRGAKDPRGTMPISHDISGRPQEANERSRIGDWESDTVLGKKGGSCLVTNVDRKSGYLVGGKAGRKASADVAAVMIGSLSGMPLHSITPDRGKEFASHAEVTEALGVEFYFAFPHHSWERGTNENTNGLLREYFPKGEPIEDYSEEEVQAVYDKLNRRPRKRLGYLTPYEVFHSTSLHLL